MPSSTYYAVLLALVLGVGCGKKGERLLPPEPPKETPNKLIDDPIVEAAIRKELKKHTGELTEADLGKLTDTGHMDRLSIFDFLLPSLPES